VEVVRDGVAREFGREFHLGTVDEAHDLEIRVQSIGERVAPPHVAQSCDEDSDGHLTAPAVIPRMSCREKMR
jgi:hypothetical protein